MQINRYVFKPLRGYAESIEAETYEEAKEIAVVRFGERFGFEINWSYRGFQPDINNTLGRKPIDDAPRFIPNLQPHW